MSHSRSKIETDRTARVQVSNKCHFWLDEPADWSLKMRNLRLEGWCVAKSGEPIVAIRACLRGQTFAGRFLSRPEVRKYLQRPDAPLRCGFGVDVRVPFGQSRLELQVARADGEWFKLFARDVRGPFRITAQERGILARRAQGDLYSDAPFFIDRPAAEQWDDRRRQLRITGWHFAREGPPITEIRARIRGKIYPGKYAQLRPDIAAMHDGAMAALRSGFLVEVPAPVGRAKLILEAQDHDGVWREFFVRRVRGRLLGRRYAGDLEAVGSYAEWIDRYDRLTKKEIAKIRHHVTQLARRPRFSVLLPVYNTDPRWLRRAIQSVRAQLYPEWELCIVDDASTAPEVWPLLQRLARNDARIKIHRRAENGHVSVASNDALALASGEFIALLDHDDELAPSALYFAACALNDKPDLQLLYSDEDKLTEDGRRCDPYFKSDWNPDLLTSQNYISHLGIYATPLVHALGGFRAGFEGSQDYDLALRCVEQLAPAQIHHLPHVLYHWRITDQSTADSGAAKPYAHTAALRAVREHVQRGPTAGRASRGYADYLRVEYEAPRDSLVSIIIATRDRLPLLRQCVESIHAKTADVRYELIIIDNESREAETLAYLAQLVEARILRAPGEFNFSRLNNLGAGEARGEFIAFLNNDLEVVGPDWLREMLSHAARPGVGAVGARLWYPDGRLQHGGVLLGVGGIANHAHLFLREEPGYFARARLTQNFCAVTGACLVMRRSLFHEIGGFDETNLPVAFNDVDLCLRLRARGWRIVWTPYAELVHHESASRGLDDTREKQQRFRSETAFMQERWGPLIEADPYYNPNLSLEPNEQFKLAFPPRVTAPWQ